ncbi:MAG: RluA family pseudouridine synthase [Candidatus Tectomicrobia bacterium]|nr:RluA family pseudouridine synthase [Candidatus Tectomicrobia bacterium]
MSNLQGNLEPAPAGEAGRLEFRVDAPDEGRRLDVFLAGHPEAPRWSRARVQQLIRGGNVRVESAAGGDGGPAGPLSSAARSRAPRPGTLLRPGDRILVTLPPPEPAEAVPEDIPLDVLFEDAHLVVVNKPAGLVVHPAAGHARGTLVNALLARCPDLTGIGGRLRPGIVHRLDKDTSGLMVVAKTELALTRLQAALKARRVERVYLALAWGTFPDEGRIEGPIGRHPLHRKKMAVVEKGRPAVTRFRVVERFGKRALLEVRLETGRTHQIRVHLAHRGSPVIGDPVYGVRHKGDPPIGRQALHAHRLCFDHPVTGERLRFEAPPPEDVQRALGSLRAEKA